MWNALSWSRENSFFCCGDGWSSAFLLRKWYKLICSQRMKGKKNILWPWHSPVSPFCPPSLSCAISTPTCTSKPVLKKVDASSSTSIRSSWIGQQWVPLFLSHIPLSLTLSSLFSPCLSLPLSFYQIIHFIIHVPTQNPLSSSPLLSFSVAEDH